MWSGSKFRPAKSTHTRFPLGPSAIPLPLRLLRRARDRPSGVLDVLTGTLDGFAGGQKAKGGEKGGEGSDGHDTSPVVI